MKRVIYYILLLSILLPASAQAQGWRGSVNGQELFSGTAARPQINNGPTLGNASYFWLALYVKNINFGTGGVLKLPDGTAAAPSLTFTSDTGTGLFKGATTTLSFTANGHERARINTSGVTTVGGVQFSQNEASIGSPDVILAWDAANTLAQRNGVNAQTFNLYSTYTDGTHYELSQWFTDSGGGHIRTATMGGSSRALSLGVGFDDWQFGTAHQLSSVNLNALATTSTDGLVLQNTTAATVGVPQQYSPRLRLSGTGYNSVSTLSETDGYIIQAEPSTAAGVTGATLDFLNNSNGGAFVSQATLTSGGNWNLQGNLSIGTGKTVSVGAATGVTGTCDTPTFTGGVATTCGGSGGSADGTYFVTTDFTTANNTNFQAITGLAWTFPVTTALNVPFRCSLTYAQATAAVSDSLGIQDVTVAPTNGMFTGSAETALGTTAYGDLTAFSSTTATAVVTFTPSAITTIFVAYIDGMIEQPSNASTSAFQIQIKTTVGADAITVKRGSYCKVG